MNILEQHGLTREKLNELNTLPLPGIETEPRYKYILLGKVAIQISGKWETIFQKHAAIYAAGIKAPHPGSFPYVYATRSKMLHDGFTVFYDTNPGGEIYHANITWGPGSFKRVVPPGKTFHAPIYL